MKAIITRNDQTAVLELPTSRMELAGSLSRIGIRTPAYIIPCSDEEEDYIRVKLFGESDFENELTALVTPKDSLGSVNTALDLYRELPQTQKEKLNAELMQNPPDSLSSLCHKVMDFQPKYVTEDYYFPLTVTVYEYNEYGDLDYGLLNYPELECDYIRVGVALYGVLSSINDKTKLELDLRPVLSLKAKVVLIRKIKQGESVGYSRAFTATRDSLIAILPIGYADGFPRNLSCGNSYVLIGGRQAPIVGKICMDQLAVDVTDIPNVKTGSIATLIGKDGKEEITAPMVAESAESITNELLSRMGHRLNIIRRA